MEENVSGCFFSEHRVQHTNTIILTVITLPLYLVGWL